MGESTFIVKGKKHFYDFQQFLILKLFISHMEVTKNEIKFSCHKHFKVYSSHVLGLIVHTIITRAQLFKGWIELSS